jgi:hypothetical protein
MGTVATIIVTLGIGFLALRFFLIIEGLLDEVKELKQQLMEIKYLLDERFEEQLKTKP